MRNLRAPLMACGALVACTFLLGGCDLKDESDPGDTYGSDYHNDVGELHLDTRTHPPPEAHCDRIEAPPPAPVVTERRKPLLYSHSVGEVELDYK